MTQNLRRRPCLLASGALAALVAGVLCTAAGHRAHAGIFHHGCAKCCNGCGAVEGVQFEGPPDGAWYWLRSPDEEKRVVMALYNRYCIRCHGVDGRGVWDIPDVPNFTNPAWQASRGDAELARIIIEGRGAVMPPFRGTFTLEEAWAMARYLRTFVPGTEASRPDLSTPAKPPNSTPPAGLGQLPPAVNQAAVP